MSSVEGRSVQEVAVSLSRRHGRIGKIQRQVGA